MRLFCFFYWPCFSVDASDTDPEASLLSPTAGAAVVEGEFHCAVVSVQSNNKLVVFVFFTLLKTPFYNEYNGASVRTQV